MKPRRLPPTVLLLLATAIAAPAQAWKDTLPATLDGLAKDYYLPTVTAAFGTLTHAASGIPTPFSRLLEDAATRSRSVKFPNKATAAAMHPAFKTPYGDLFTAGEVGALLYGRYNEEEDAILARTELTGLTDGILIGSADFRIPTSSLPAGMAVAPIASAAQVRDSLAAVLPAGAAPGLKLSIATERGAGAVYREGEDLVILLTLDRDAWVKVYHVGVGGRVSLIWPNQYGGGDGLLRAGSVVRIPETNDTRFSFRMTPPYGTEFIKAIASTQPFAATEAGSAAPAGAGNAPRAVFTRGLVLVGTTSANLPVSAAAAGAGQPLMADAMASYVIIPAK